MASAIRIFLKVKATINTSIINKCVNIKQILRYITNALAISKE